MAIAEALVKSFGLLILLGLLALLTVHFVGVTQQIRHCKKKIEASYPIYIYIIYIYILYIYYIYIYDLTN
jgi:prepilin signal peptidase PulO-like enzyme (type II secretory pathway)